MNIRTKLYLTAVFLTVVSIAVIFFAMANTRHVIDQLEHGRQASVLAQLVAELALLTESYITYGEERHTSQWHSRVETIRDVLRDEDFADQQSAMDLALETLERSFHTLHQLKDNQIGDASTDENEGRLSITIGRLAARMRTESQSLMASSFAAAGTARDQVETYTVRYSWVITALGLLLIVSVMITTVSLAFNVNSRIGRLLEGVKTLGKGDFSHRISAISNDETGELAAAFNTMAENLDRQIQQTHQSLREKEILLRELHHRTRNSMQVIIAMLQIRAAASGDDRVKSAIQESTERIISMSLVHKNLYETQNLSTIDTQAVLEDIRKMIIRDLSCERRSIRIDLDVSPVTISLDTAIPFALVLYELVSNAVHHGFTDKNNGGTVSISLHKGGNDVTLVVRDDGRGMPEEFDFWQNCSVGLQFVALIVEHQLNGSLDFRNGQGVTCCVRFTEPQGTSRI